MCQETTVAMERPGERGIFYVIIVGDVFQVSTEQFHFWLSGLREISHAEQRVLSGHVSGHVCTVQLLSQAIVHCQKASAALKVGSLVICGLSL